MQFNLVPHPTTPPAAPEFKVWANVDHAGSLGATATTNIWFGVGSPASRFSLPPAEESIRADKLWEATCFEAFLRREGDDAYREWNFAPSTEWAVYDFAGYREGRSDAEIPSSPYLRMEDNFTWWAMGATIAVESGIDWQLGLSAVIEEQDGTKSYWALVHPDEGKPDFHHPDCFAARLP